MTRNLLVAASIAALASAMPAAGAPIVFSSAGADAAAIQAEVDAFRDALGANNGNVAGSQGAGRREISWDGGGAAAPATVFPSPMTTFASRGNINTTPGTGFEISGAPLPEFGEINPTYPDIFQTFSSPRLFAPLGSNVTDSAFTIPGTTDQPAVTNAFGAVFTDVDLAGVTGIEFFDIKGRSLGIYYADVADAGLSFIGVLFDSPIVSRARITTGNAALGPVDGGGVDVVAMDDFIYGEPLVGVSEPATMALFGLAFAGLVSLRRRR